MACFYIIILFSFGNKYGRVGRDGIPNQLSFPLSPKEAIEWREGLHYSFDQKTKGQERERINIKIYVMERDYPPLDKK